MIFDMLLATIDISNITSTGGDNAKGLIELFYLLAAACVLLGFVLAKAWRWALGALIIAGIIGVFIINLDNIPALGQGILEFLGVISSD